MPYLEGGELELNTDSVKLLNYHFSAFVAEPSHYRDVVIERVVVDVSTVEETSAETLKRKAEDVAEPANKLDDESFADVVATASMSILAATAELRSDEEVDGSVWGNDDWCDRKGSCPHWPKGLSQREDARTEIKKKKETRMKAGLEEAISQSQVVNTSRACKFPGLQKSGRKPRKTPRERGRTQPADM